MAEGTYNFTSLGTSQEEEPLQQIVDVEDEEEQGPDEDDDGDDAQARSSLDQRNDEEDLDKIREVTVAKKIVDCEELLLHQETYKERKRRGLRGVQGLKK